MKRGKRTIEIVVSERSPGKEQQMETEKGNKKNKNGSSKLEIVQHLCNTVMWKICKTIIFIARK